MKQMVVDAMVEADREKHFYADNVKALCDAGDFGRASENLELATKHKEQFLNFRAYILAHMTETPWVPVKGADDD